MKITISHRFACLRGESSFFENMQLKSDQTKFTIDYGVDVNRDLVYIFSARTTATLQRMESQKLIR